MCLLQQDLSLAVYKILGVSVFQRLLGIQNRPMLMFTFDDGPLPRCICPLIVFL